MPCHPRCGTIPTSGAASAGRWSALAELHLLRPDAVGLGGLGRPQGFLERQVAGWAKRWALVAPEGPSRS